MNGLGGEWRQAVGVAPGRLDVLGGVADYSGSLVLQMPLTLTTRVVVEERSGGRLEFTSDEFPATTLPPLPEGLIAAAAADAAALRQWLDEQAAPRWVRYPVGCLALFAATWH